MGEFEKLQVMCEAVGSDATPDQIHRIQSFIIQEIAMDDWRHAANLTLDYGIDGIYTEITMRLGEMGRYK